MATVIPARSLLARSFLVRGLLAGLLAGVVAFGVAYVVGEPSVDAAIAVEDAQPHGTGMTHDADTDAHAGGTVVPRSLQSTLGLLTGTAVAGVTLGGLVGVLSAVALGRFGRLGARASTLLVAGTGFVALYLLPFVAYPPNPPAVGSASTIGVRTEAYFVFLAVSAIAAVAGVLWGRRLAVRWGSWYASLTAGAGYLAVTLVVARLLPRFSEVPADFPAAVLYDFRGASLVVQLSLWVVLGVVLAELVHRLTRPVVAVEPRPVPVVPGLSS